MEVKKIDTNKKGRESLSLLHSQLSEDVKRAFTYIEKLALNLNNFNIFLELSGNSSNGIYPYNRELNELKQKNNDLQKIILKLEDENKVLRDSCSLKSEVLQAIETLLGGKQSQIRKKSFTGRIEV